MYIEVVLPLALPKTYTYAVPPELEDAVQTGVRAEVQFGRSKLYAALIVRVVDTPPDYKTKPITAILDAEPIVSVTQLQFWQWMANYYCCYLGEVMNAALPSGLRLGSETRVVLAETYQKKLLENPESIPALNDDEFMVAEALSVQNELTIENIKDILDKKTVHGIIQGLIQKEIIVLKEELQLKYKPKEITMLRWREPYRSDPETINSVLDKIPKNAELQTKVVLTMVTMGRNGAEVLQKEVLDKTGAQPAVIQTLAKKGYFEVFKKTISRTATGSDDDLALAAPMAPQQIKAFDSISAHFQTKNVVLLHGITGSGKTRVYTELIQQTIAEGKQVLYLLPEIALTAQIIERLQLFFGSNIATYHSKLNNNERVDMWKDVLGGKPIVLSARSGLFLPFRNLGLIIVDEEHDPSYKQFDPSPRYNARDASVFLASLYKAKVLLGTATPSIESYFNAKMGKYGLVELNQRFGKAILPEIRLVDLKNAIKQKKINGSFSETLIEELKITLERKEQAILFQNRRGYAPAMQCTTCGWTQDCVQCDVALTYHLHFNALRCHYCGYQSKLPKDCPACGNSKFTTKGFGTEKVEEELQILLPDAKIARMDVDTVRGKYAHAQLIEQFENKEIDILVGTQMVTKGLDFESVRLVGVLSADQLLHFPDFRASERAFQLITQVAGRAGRSEVRGTVLVQALDSEHPVIGEVLTQKYTAHYERELAERWKFFYPPYFRLIHLELRHKDRATVQEAAKWIANILKETLGNAVLGPAEPGIAWLRGLYLMQIMIKLERSATNLVEAKTLVLNSIQELGRTKGYTTVQAVVNVDPY